MRKLAIIAPAVMVMLSLTTKPAQSCSAIVVNGAHETIAYTCWAANLTEVPKAIAPPVALPVYDYTPKPKAKAKTKKKTKKCWYKNKRGKKRWRRC